VNKIDVNAQRSRETGLPFCSRHQHMTCAFIAIVLRPLGLHPQCH
jgi:hypothetical protein